MNSSYSSEATNSNASCHLVAVPYPGRGHINPVLNTCKLLAASKSKSPHNNILITVVLTEEWLGLLSSDPKPDKIRFATIPNVLPSEHVRVAHFSSFLEAVWTKMEDPFLRLLDGLQPSPTLIMADTFLYWAVSAGNRRNIPVVSYWPMSATNFYKLYRNFSVPGRDPDPEPEKQEEIPNQPHFSAEERRILYEGVSNAFSWLPRASYLFISSIYELESKRIDAFKPKFSFPVYTVGPSIPYFELQANNDGGELKNYSYLEWLDKQPHNSVLYVSLGSFLSVSTLQMDEIAAALNDSHVRFLWVAREETARVKEACGEKNELGLVVTWCNQLRVLSHPSVGGFLSHCGWNSVQEGLFSGIPFLTYPIVADQEVNSWLIVENWKIGWRMRKSGDASESLVTREEIAQLLRKLMDLESSSEMRRRAKELQDLCFHAVAEDGSCTSSIKSFINNIST